MLATQPDVKTLLDEFDRVFEFWRGTFKKNTCIEQTRLLLEVMRKFGVEVEPVNVKL